MRCGCKRLSRRHMDLIGLCRPFAVRRRQHHRIFASDALHKTCNPLSPLPFGCKGKREQIDMFNCNCHAVQCSWNVCFISSRITECGNEENHWRLPRTGTVESLRYVVNASNYKIIQTGFINGETKNPHQMSPYRILIGSLSN